MLNSFDFVHQVSTQLQDTTAMSVVINTVKGVAIAFVLWGWMAEYQKLATTGKFDVFKIIWGVVYISAIGASTQILNMVDSLMVEVGNSITTALPIPNSEYELFSGDDTISDQVETGDATSDWMNSIGKFFSAAAMSGLIFQIVKDFVMVFVIVIDYVFFIAREFMLLFLSLCFPLVMALGAMNVGEGKKIPDIVWKFIRGYMGLYLLGYGYVLAIAFTSYFFSAAAMSGTFVLASDVYNLLWLFVLLFAKYRIFSELNGAVKSIF